MKNDDIDATAASTHAGSRTLLEEALTILGKARRALETSTHETTTTPTQKDKKVRQAMSSELTPQRAGELYTSGQSVIEVARAYGMTYAQVRKLLATNGTEIRNASERLKGRTRTRKSAES